MARKNLSGLGGNDILLIWQYENAEGKDVYAIHTVIDYKVGQRPLGTFTFGPKDDKAVIQRSNTTEGRFFAADLT